MMFNIFNTLTNERLSPIHYGIGDILSSLVLMTSFGSDKIFLRITLGCIIILILVSCLIFTEILVLSFCGLEKYTSSYISERGLLENIEEKSIFSKAEIDLNIL